MENQESHKSSRVRRRLNPHCRNRAAGTEPGVSWRADRRGRHGRLRQEHATLFVEALARNRRLPAAFYGVEFVAAGEIRDAARKTAAAADADDIFAAACGRFCGPLRAPDHAAAARRLPGAGRPLHLHGVCARCRPRVPAALAAQSLPLCACSGHHVLFSRAAGRGRAPHSERASQTEILRSGDGSGLVVRSRGKFPTCFRRASSKSTTRWWTPIISWCSTERCR